MAGPTTDAVLVNLLLGGRLEEMLIEWRTAQWDAKTRTYTPPVSYEEIARRINVLIAETADRLNAPTREFKWSAIYRWVNSVYEIGQ